MYKDIEQNIQYFKSIFNKQDMVVFRKINKKHKICIIFQDGMSDGSIISEFIIKPLLENASYSSIDSYIEKSLYASQVQKNASFDECIHAILKGDTVVLFDGEEQGVICDTKHFNSRGNEEVSEESVLRGPKECFNEVLMHSTALIRRKLQVHSLKIETTYLNTSIHEQIAYVYMEDKVDYKALELLKKKIQSIQIKDNFDTNTLAEKISNRPLALFQTYGISERVDVIASKIIEGKIAVIVDGSCEVLWAPYVFLEAFHSPDDYYLPYIYASMSRLLRFIGYFISIMLPGIYLAFCIHNPSLFPTSWKELLPQTNQGGIIEVLLMFLGFELLKEATLRGPTQLSNSLGIVSGIIFGDALIKSNIVSLITLFVMALSSLCSIMNVKIQSSIIVVKAIFILLGILFGINGILFGIVSLYIYIHFLKSLNESFGKWIKTSKGFDSIIRVPSIIWKKRNK